ncbi:MAG: DUF721 domain-containing protein [Desulfamplus sp.]|nr:DUF721 domain-containing protein [Desulfamplus sp.]
MKGKMTHVGDILESALKNFRPSGDTGMTRIWDLWHVSVGETIAREAKPGAFKDGILIVNVSSSVWMQQLTFLKQDIVAKLNQILECEMVKEIRFKIAKVHN